MSFRLDCDNLFYRNQKGASPAADENALVPSGNDEQTLTKAELNALADVPPEIEWFANLQNPNTRRAYQTDLRSFRRFAGIPGPTEFRRVTRAHVIAWRKQMEKDAMAPSTIQSTWWLRNSPPLSLSKPNKEKGRLASTSCKAASVSCWPRPHIARTSTQVVA